MICATVDGVQLEIATASEPLYFSHVNCSDEYALALPTGDELVDRFPLRTFLSDPKTGSDVGRYDGSQCDCEGIPCPWLQHVPQSVRFAPRHVRS